MLKAGDIGVTVSLAARTLVLKCWNILKQSQVSFGTRHILHLSEHLGLDYGVYPLTTAQSIKTVLLVCEELRKNNLERL